MAYRQPRIPEYREEDGAGKCLRALILLLKDFALAAWAANNRRMRETKALEKRIGALETRLMGETADKEA